MFDEHLTESNGNKRNSEKTDGHRQSFSTILDRHLYSTSNLVNGEFEQFFFIWLISFRKEDLIIHFLGIAVEFYHNIHAWKSPWQMLSGGMIIMEITFDFFKLIHTLESLKVSYATLILLKITYQYSENSQTSEGELLFGI